MVRAKKGGANRERSWLPCTRGKGTGDWGGKMKECGKNSPVVVCIDGSTSSGDVEATTTTPPIRQSPATARRKHLSWIRILPHSSDHGPSETLFEHNNRALAINLATRSNRATRFETKRANKTHRERERERERRAAIDRSPIDQWASDTIGAQTMDIHGVHTWSVHLVGRDPCRGRR